MNLIEETTTALSNLEYINPWYHICCSALMRPNSVLSAVAYSLVPHDD